MVLAGFIPLLVLTGPHVVVPTPRALVVGVGSYANPAYTKTVVDNDVEAVASALTSWNMRTLTFTGSEATKKAVLGALTRLGEGSNGNLAVHFSGRSVRLTDPERGGLTQSYFIPYDGDETKRETLIGAKDLEPILASLRTKGQILVSLDCCYSGGFGLARDDDHQAIIASVGPSEPSMTFKSPATGLEYGAGSWAFSKALLALQPGATMRDLVAAMAHFKQKDSQAHLIGDPSLPLLGLSRLATKDGDRYAYERFKHLVLTATDAFTLAAGGSIEFPAAMPFGPGTEWHVEAVSNGSARPIARLEVAASPQSPTIGSAKLASGDKPDPRDGLLVAVSNVGERPLPYRSELTGKNLEELRRAGVFSSSIGELGGSVIDADWGLYRGDAQRLASLKVVSVSAAHTKLKLIGSPANLPKEPGLTAVLERRRLTVPPATLDVNPDIAHSFCAGFIAAAAGHISTQLHGTPTLRLDYPRSRDGAALQTDTVDLTWAETGDLISQWHGTQPPNVRGFQDLLNGFRFWPAIATVSNPLSSDGISVEARLVACDVRDGIVTKVHDAEIVGDGDHVKPATFAIQVRVWSPNPKELLHLSVADFAVNGGGAEGYILWPQEPIMAAHDTGVRGDGIWRYLLVNGGVVAQQPHGPNDIAAFQFGPQLGPDVMTFFVGRFPIGLDGLGQLTRGLPEARIIDSRMNEDRSLSLSAATAGWATCSVRLDVTSDEQIAHTRGKIAVIAIGCGKSKTPLLMPLDADRDIRAFSDAMRELYKANVTELHDATRADLLNALRRTIRKLPSDDTLVLYFTGHGGVVKSGGIWQPALFPIDTVADGEEIRPESVVTLAEVRACLAAAPPSNQVVIMDTCEIAASINGLNVQDYFTNGLSPEKCATNLLFIGVHGEAMEQVEKGAVLTQCVTQALPQLRGSWTARRFGAAVRKNFESFRAQNPILEKEHVVSFTLGQDFALTQADAVDFKLRRPLRPQAQDRGNVATKPKSSGQGGVGKSYAIIIETETYDDNKDFHNLPNPPVDAAQLKDVLEKVCGFEPVVVLEHPDQDKIVVTIEAYMSPQVVIGPNDQLLVYVAGHGDLKVDKTDKDDTGKGYLVLKNTIPSPSWQHYLQYDTLVDWLNGVSQKAAARKRNAFRHVCLMVDACYDGSFFRCFNAAESARISDDTSGLAICSVPGDQPASDGFPGAGSPFALAIEKLLREIKPGSSLEIEELEGGLKRALPKTKPLHGPILGRAREGDFTFTRPPAKG